MSKTNGRKYWFNTKTNKSIFDIPGDGFATFRYQFVFIVLFLPGMIILNLTLENAFGDKVMS